MRRPARNRMVLAMAVLMAAWVALALPAAAQTTAPTVTSTETTVVTGLPTTGHGVSEPSDAEALALEHTLLTIVVLLAAAAMALGGIALLWRYERR